MRYLQQKGIARLGSFMAKVGGGASGGAGAGLKRACTPQSRAAPSLTDAAPAPASWPGPVAQDSLVFSQFEREPLLTFGSKHRRLDSEAGERGRGRSRRKAGEEDKPEGASVVWRFGLGCSVHRRLNAAD